MKYNIKETFGGDFEVEYRTELRQKEKEEIAYSLLGSCSSGSYYVDLYNLCPLTGDYIVHKAAEECGVWLCESCGWWFDETEITVVNGENICTRCEEFENE